MRFSSSVFIITLLLLAPGALTEAQSSATNTFTENLSLGSRSAQVIALQKILNEDQDTRIASSGPGSLGYETAYFGSLTRAAVVRFQVKYASEVLTPVGLTRGNGFVGSYTRAKLNALTVTVADTVSASPPVVSPVISPPVTSIPAPVAVSPTPTPVIETTHQNPNLKNVDKYFAALEKVAAKQGYTSVQITEMKQSALDYLATTTDLRATFLKTVQNSAHQALESSFVGRILAIAEQAFGKVFLPERALAATGIPFGGALLFAMPCNGGMWNITLEPLPPTFPVLLAYMSGTQAFLSYNIPFTTWLLGEYEPVPMAYCWVGYYPYPSEGIISPMTGSSLL